MTFDKLRLSEPLLRALAAEGYTTPTPIQAQAIPHVLQGRDLLGVAQTGTGKTAAFALPIIQRLSEHKPVAAEPVAAPKVGERGHGHRPRTTRRVRALILAPTRELAAQIGESFRAYGRHAHLRHAVIFGGVGQNPQVQALHDGVDVLVATPGRLLDLIGQGHVDFRAVEVFVLDEADRMLDMGFIPDIRRIVAKLPASPHPQTLLFSATMPPDIRDLASTILRDPVSVHVAPTSTTADRIDQAVYFVDKRNKPALLAHLLGKTSYTRALVFTRTKHGADRVTKQLDRAGIAAAAIHGNKSQNARQRALENFRSGKTAVLIASDIAARGIDIDEISHVINFDLPNIPETYVHRIGRTARAGAAGHAISFCDQEERAFLRDIEKLTKVPIPVRNDQPAYPAAPPFEETSRPPRRGQTPRRPTAPRASHTDSGAAHTDRQGASTPRPHTSRATPPRDGTGTRAAASGSSSRGRSRRHRW